MAVCFLETSALVKRYVQETGTVWVGGLFAPAAGNLLCIAQIAGVETVAAVTLRAWRGATTPGDAATALTSFRLDFARDFYRIPADLAVITRAMDLAEGHGLRGYDAVQLATALLLEVQAIRTGLGHLVFICADNNLNAAAAAEGLATDDPNTHP